MQTYILDVQKMSTEDGPGIRTTVFFKGCNLNCKWCHNPESISSSQHIFWLEDRCMGCNTCIEVCPNGAVSLQSDGIKTDNKLCDFCNKCIEECPMNALEIKGEVITVEALVNELIKDKAYYDTSHGGVTLSGGEVVLNWQYALELLKELKTRGVHTAIDTAGCYSYSVLENLLPYVDLILYDIKHIDNDKHKQLTGVENTLILENAKKLGSLEKPKIWIRTPIIPDATDSEENIIGIANFIKDNMPNIEKWELVSFNNLGKQKYKLLGRDWVYKDSPLITKAKMQRLNDLAKQITNKVTWSGATRLEV